MTRRRNRVRTRVGACPADEGIVFATQAEFLAHHKEISLEEAEYQLMVYPPDKHMAREFRQAQERAKQGKAFVEPVKNG